MPSRGSTMPAIAPISVVFPEPEGPRTAMTPEAGSSKRASRRKSPRRRRTSTRSVDMVMTAKSGPRPAKRPSCETEPEAQARIEPFARGETEKREQDRDRREPRRRALPAGGLQRHVDGERQGARLALDIGREDDDGTELPEAAVKPIAAAVSTPGAMSGKVTLAKTSAREAPRVRAAASRPRSMASSASLMARAMIGRIITAVAMTTALVVRRYAGRTRRKGHARSARARQAG